MKLDKEKIGKNIEGISKKTTNMVTKSKEANGDGNIDIEDVIILGLKTPGIGIDRKEFLTGIPALLGVVDIAFSIVSLEYFFENSLHLYHLNHVAIN